MTKLVEDLTKNLRTIQEGYTEARFQSSQRTKNDLSTHVTALLNDHASLATTVQQNDAQNNTRLLGYQQQLTSMQSTITNQASMITNFINSHPKPAASPIAFSPADMQNAIKDGPLAFWQNASSQGMTPSQTIAATGITPATQGQPPTQVVTTLPAQTKKLMLGSILFGHINPDEVPVSVIENYFFMSDDKTHQNWIKKNNTLSHFISPHYGLAQYVKSCNCPIRFEELLYNTIDGFYITKDSFNAQYEAIFASAPTACPTWLDVPTGQTPASVVCKDRIYALGPDGKKFYEDQLQIITPQFSPDPSRDMNLVYSPFYNHSGHVHPSALHPLAQQYCISLLRFCTPADEDANRCTPLCS